MLIGYARVSTKDQDRALQLDALTVAGCEKIFEGRPAARKRIARSAAALDHMREGHVLVVWKLDRLSRSMKQLIDILQKRGVEFKSLTDAIDTTTHQGKLGFGIVASLAEFEPSLIRERVNAGLAAARIRGRVGGRPKVNADAITQAQALVKGGMSTAKAAKLARISRSTLYRAAAN